MPQINNDFLLIRESKWVKEYETPEGRILDSKYRTFRCDATAAKFVEAWQVATHDERRDMEAAFTFFPADPVSDRELILKSVAIDDPDLATRMRAAWEAHSSVQPKQQVEFLRQLFLYLAEIGVKDEFVAENRWFRALMNDAGVVIEPLVQNAKEVPTDEELQELCASVTSPAYRHAINLVRGCRSIMLTPEPNGNFKAEQEQGRF